MAKSGDPVEFGQPLFRHRIDPPCLTSSSSPIVARLRYESCAPAGELGIKTVAVHSTADYSLKHRAPRRRIGVHRPAVLDFELPQHAGDHQRRRKSPIRWPSTRATDFLSENADFAERVEKSGFVFVGPKSRNHPQARDKSLCDPHDEGAGVPCVPDRTGRWAPIRRRICASLATLGYPS